MSEVLLVLVLVLIPFLRYNLNCCFQEDHNADKKVAVASLARMDSMDSLDHGDDHSPTFGPTDTRRSKSEERLSDRCIETHTADSHRSDTVLLKIRELSAEKDATNSTTSVSRETPDEQPKPEKKSTTPTEPHQTYSELELFHIAYLQLGALKVLGVILSSAKFAELLLVPRKELSTEKRAFLEPSQKTEEEIQESLRMVMKQMIKRAIVNTPIKNKFSVNQLERAHTIMYDLVLTSLAEKATGLKIKKG